MKAKNDASKLIQLEDQKDQDGEHSEKLSDSESNLTSLSNIDENEDDMQNFGL